MYNDSQYDLMAHKYPSFAPHRSFLYIYHSQHTQMNLKILSLFLLCSISSFAKDKEPAIKNGSYTISIAMGTPSIRKNLFNYGKAFKPISITADRQLTKHFSVGLQYAYCHSTTDPVIMSNVYFGNVNVRNVKYEQRSRYHSISAGGEYCYLNKGRFWMACGLALSLEVPKHEVLSLTDSNNADISYLLSRKRTPHLNYRLRLADVKFNATKNLGLCAGIGVGLEGLLTFGVLYKFNGSK